ncbi:hypothetical protein EDB85DRAFT_2147244 [Lactarius pseudohatsudake]|nr:hypothetical protein EDB85DRAFT_2147244 [Lactarius pseudohatsudake]
MARKTAKPIHIILGHWSREADRTGNFVYVIAGKLSMAQIGPYADLLCAPFPGSSLVPSEGWAWGQLRGVMTHNEAGEFFSEEELEAELRLHPAFEHVQFIVAPHWLTHPNNIREATATVGFALEDPTGAAIQAASAGPVSMFSYQVKFVPCGDAPTLIQCGRCHLIGHRTDDKKCKWRKDQIRCVRCGRDHHVDDHHFEAMTPIRASAPNGATSPPPRRAKVAGRAAAPPPKGSSRAARIDDAEPIAEAHGTPEEDIHIPDPTDEEMAAARADHLALTAQVDYVDWGAEPNLSGWGETDTSPAAAATTAAFKKTSAVPARRVTTATDTAKPGESSTDRAMARKATIHTALTTVPAAPFDPTALQGRSVEAGKGKGPATAEPQTAQSVPRRITAEMIADAVVRLAQIELEDAREVCRVRAEGQLWEFDICDATDTFLAHRLEEARAHRKVIAEDLSVFDDPFPTDAELAAAALECPVFGRVDWGGVRYTSPGLCHARRVQELALTPPHA